MSDERKPELICSIITEQLRARPDAAFSREQLEHLSLCDACAEALVLRELTSTPEPEIPAAFAANLCARLPQLPPAPAPARHNVSGHAAAMAASLLLVCGASLYFALSPQHWIPAGMLGLSVGAMLVTETAALAWWLGTPPASR